MKLIALITGLMLFIALGASQTSSNIDLKIKNTEPVPLQTSEYADVWLEVENTGNAEAENLEVSFQENYPFSTDRKKRWEINSLQPGETYQIHLEARVSENTVQGNNSLDFKISSGGFSYTRKVPVEVRSDRNVLSVKDIDFPNRVAPGTSNKMSLELENLADSQLKNIEVSLDVSGEDLPFATSDSSTKNLDAVERGESLSLNYTLNIDESAENSVYKLPIEIRFEDEAGTEFTQETTTGVNVGGTPDLEAELNTEDALTEGTREITFRLVNRGHGSADFVSMELQENENIEVIGSNDVYIGSMDSDDFQTASFRVNVNAEQESVEVNEIDFPVEISYTDQSGDKTETQEVSAELYSHKDLQRYGLSSGNSLVPIAAVGLILIAGGLLYWRRKRKK
jgi:LPXTG-motif cell wall-anchored protein